MGNDAEWLSILQRSLFATSADDVSASLAHLTDIFVERHHLLWKVHFFNEACIFPSLKSSGSIVSRILWGCGRSCLDFRCACFCSGN